MSMAFRKNISASRADHTEVPLSDTCKEFHLPPEEARADTYKEPIQNAIDGRTNYPIPYSPTLESDVKLVKSSPKVKQKRNTWSKKKRLWTLLVGGSLLVMAVIGGTIGGLYAHKHRSANATSTLPPPSTPSSFPSPAWNASNSSLASVAWTDHSGLAQRRLYHQTFAGMIMESAWNSSAQIWYLSNIALTRAMPGSPLAAAVVGPQNFTFVSNQS